jgi:integrase
VTTHSAAHTKAVTFWDAKGNSGRVMGIRSKACIKMLGGMGRKLSSLSAVDGTDLLSKLRHSGLSRSSVIAYYAAYRRMLTLSGLPTHDWPGAGSPARRLRTPIPQEALTKMVAWLRSQGCSPTADLLHVLACTGGRIAVEALKLEAGSFDRGWWTVTGKGGHERAVPVLDPLAQQILQDRDRVLAYQKLSYERHRQLWHKAAQACGIADFTPHSVRHAYATNVYERSGKDLIVTRDLLGHSNINTTAGYVGVDREALLRAAG